MDVKYLNYILAIAEQKNMTKAAKELFVSQSSLSQYLARLEQELSTPLFFRTKSELIPTPAGQLYLEAAQKVVDIQRDLYRSIASLGRRGSIRIGVTSNFGFRILSETIPQYKETYPEVAIEISELGLPELKKALASEGLDLGIAAMADTDPLGEMALILRREEVLFAVPISDPFVRQKKDRHLTAAELAANFFAANFLNSKRGSSLRTLANQVFESASFAPHSICETNNITTTRSMVAHSSGVSFLPESCSIGRDRIAYFSMDPPLYRLNVLLTRKNWNPSEAEEAFYQAIAHYFDQNTQTPYLAEDSAMTD